MDSTAPNCNPHATRLEDLFEPRVGVSLENRQSIEDASTPRSASASAWTLRIEPTDPVSALLRHIHLSAQRSPHLAQRLPIAHRRLAGAMPDFGERQISQKRRAVHRSELLGHGSIKLTAAHPDSVRARVMRSVFRSRTPEPQCREFTGAEARRKTTMWPVHLHGPHRVLTSIEIYDARVEVASRSST